MQAMNALDASFLDVEDSVSHMHIGSVGIFEGPPPSREEAARWVLGKLPLVPRYRQTIRRPPLSLGRPVWADDEHFNLDYHLRRTALPAPGGEQELRLLVGRVMSQQLDRDKPLWEMWLVEGLDDGRWALISKIHHALVDGVAGSDLLSVLLDPDPDAPAPPVEPWAPQPGAGTRGAAGRRAGEQPDDPRARHGGGARRAAARPDPRPSRLRRGCAATATPSRPLPRRSTGRSGRTGAGPARGRRSRRSSRSGRSTAARSTTSCSPASPAAFASC